MMPTVGRIVHYTLTQQDADAINVRREHYLVFCATLTGQPLPGEPGMNGHMAHVGNTAREGDVCAATVVRTFDPSVSTANLQVHLDGNDTYWATSRQEGDRPGYWSWPPQVEHQAGDRPAQH